MRGRLLPLLCGACLLAACGGATSTAQTESAAPPPPPTGANTVTISPLDGGTETTTATAAAPASAAFPAETPSGVLALAAQHPDGRVTYATLLDGTQGEMTISRLGDRGLVVVTNDAGTTRVGVNTRDSSMTWVCFADLGGTPTCKRRDFDERGADALAAAAQLVGEDRVRQLVAAVSVTSDANLDVRTQANQVDASCLNGSDAGGALLVCVSPSGFVTDAEGNGAIARASNVSPTVKAKELEQPTT